MAHKEVWMDHRSDSIAGEGTRSNPFDASTALKFDGKMRDFYSDGVPYYIHLEPGLYLTNGGQTVVGGVVTGWRMNDIWTIAGSGIESTTVRLAEFTNPGSGGKRGARQIKTWWCVT